MHQCMITNKSYWLEQSTGMQRFILKMARRRAAGSVALLSVSYAHAAGGAPGAQKSVSLAAWWIQVPVAGPGDNLVSTMFPSETVTQPHRKCDLILPLSPGFAGCFWTKTRTVRRQTFPRTACPLFQETAKGTGGGWGRILQTPALHLGCPGITEKEGEGGTSLPPATSASVDSPALVAAEEPLRPGFLCWSSGSEASSLSNYFMYYLSVGRKDRELPLERTCVGKWLPQTDLLLWGNW